MKEYREPTWLESNQDLILALSALVLAIAAGILYKASHTKEVILHDDEQIEQ